MTQPGDDPNRQWDGQRWTTLDLSGRSVYWDGFAWRPVHPDGYWARFARRWKWSALIVGALLVLPVLTDATNLSDGFDLTATLIDAVLAFAVGGVTSGTVVNFVVAAFPSGGGGSVVPATTAGPASSSKPPDSGRTGSVDGLPGDPPSGATND